MFDIFTPSVEEAFPPHDLSVLLLPESCYRLVQNFSGPFPSSVTENIVGGVARRKLHSVESNHITFESEIR